MAPRRYRVRLMANSRLLMPAATTPLQKDSRSLRSLVPVVVGLHKASQSSDEFLLEYFLNGA